MAATDIQFKMDEAKTRMFDKAAEDRRKAEEAQELHQMSEQIRAEAKQSELADLLGKLKPAEQMQIRLAAAQLFYSDRGKIYGNQKQLQLDEITLELARYSITGSV